MADRSAMLWAVVLAAVAAVGPAARSADPVPPAAVPVLLGQPRPLDGPDALPAPPPAAPVIPPAFPSAPVTAFQQPPGGPSGGATVPELQPSDRFREPPLSPFLSPRTAPGGAAADAEQPLVPEQAQFNLPTYSRQNVRLAPRYGKLNEGSAVPIGDNTRRIVVTGGVILTVTEQTLVPNAATKLQEVELATDNAVIWAKETDAPDDGPPPDPQAPGVPPAAARKRTVYEFYLQGNVVVRTYGVDSLGRRNVEEVFRAKELYYEVARSRAIALKGDVELRTTALPEPVHMRGKEIWQLGPNEYRAFDADVASSKRPTDPALRYTSKESTLTRTWRNRRNIFGVPYRNAQTGEPVIGYEQILTSDNVALRIFDTPIFYEFRNKTDLNEPLGPLAGFGFGKDNSVFGAQVYVTWNLYRIFGLQAPPQHRWVLYTDYMSFRGLAAGTEYDYAGQDFLGFGKQATGLFKIYGLRDKGTDNLGGDRGPTDPVPDVRGRIQWRHNQDLYENGTTFLRWEAQAEKLSDQNFLEQYSKREFDFGPNQETFAYLYGAAGNVGGSLWYEQNLQRQWYTETEWLPRLDGSIVGQNLFDVFTYTARADAGYAQFRPATSGPAPVQSTDEVRDDTGRVHLYQKVAAPFDAGPVRITPYGVMDLAYYTRDLEGDARGRFYGGGGVQASVSASRLYPDVASELLNIRGLNHKITYGANYYIAHSDTPYTLLPQLDRLNDDATDFGDRATKPRQTTYLIGGYPFPGLTPEPGGAALATSPIFDPQLMAIRRLVDNRVDTLDSVNELQLSVNQRLQTKRGFPGADHVVDWMSLDTSMSVFPNKDRDNFGKATAFYEYNYLWHLGDRVSLSSQGWYDPFTTGARYYNAGVNFNRPDGTNVYLGYRYIDPIDTRAVTVSLSYKLSKKYGIIAYSTYDFGVSQSFGNQISFTRTGTDMTVLFGFSYNPLINNFGVQFAIVPNLLGINAYRLTASPLLGNQR